MPLPSYAAVTRASLRAGLDDRLNNSQFWTTAEKNLYIAEALTTWQAAARYFRKQVSFNTSNTTPQWFYDLSSVVSDLSYNTTDTQLLTLIQYHLLEPVGGIPTAQFPTAAYTDALNRRRDRFLLDSGSVVKHYDQIPVTANVARVNLGSSLIDVRRVSWETGGTQTPAVVQNVFSFVLHGANLNTVTITGVVPGNWLIVNAAFINNSSNTVTISDSSSSTWTAVKDISGQDTHNETVWFYTQATAGGSYTITVSPGAIGGSFPTLCVLEVSGISGVLTGTPNGNNATGTGLSITTTAAPALVIFVAQLSLHQTVWNNSAGWTQIQGNDGGSFMNSAMMVAWQIPGTAGTVSGTFTNQFSTNDEQGIIAFAPASSPAAAGSVIFRDDEFAANAFEPRWLQETRDPPLTYSVASTQPFVVQLIPPPTNNGFLDVLVLAQGAPLNPSSGVVLGVPDNLAWAVKFGALADLLSQDGPGRDAERAQYCEQRYQEAVLLARTLPTVINGAIAGVACELDSVFDLDAFNSSWNQGPFATPTALALAGQNIIAPSALVDPASPVTITLDVVYNAPIPPDDVTAINITADQAEIIIDYAQHLACFKSGGQEFAATVRLYENFMQQAALYRSKSGAEAPYWTAMEKSDQMELVGRRLWR